MYVIAYQISKSGCLTHGFSSSDNLFPTVVTYLGISTRRTSLTRVSTIVSIRVVVVKDIFDINMSLALVVALQDLEELLSAHPREPLLAVE